VSHVSIERYVRVREGGRLTAASMGWRCTAPFAPLRRSPCPGPRPTELVSLVVEGLPRGSRYRAFRVEPTAVL